MEAIEAVISEPQTVIGATSYENQPPSPTLSTYSTSSTLSTASAIKHDWLLRQMRIRRREYTEPLDIKIKIISWNVNGKRITEDLTSLLHEDTETGIYAIGYA